MNYEKIGEFIQEKRKEKNLTQKELAKKLGVTDKAVSKWERGLGCPDVSILEVLSKELDVSVLELLKGRKIENEVIDITEADDYIVGSIKSTKNTFVAEFTKKVELVLFVITIIILLLMVWINVERRYKLTKKYDFFVDESQSSYYDNLKILEKDIEIIKNNRGLLTESEQENVLSFLNFYYNYYNNNFLINKNHEYIKISYNDLYKQLFITEVEATMNYDPAIISVIHLAKKYSSNLDNYNDYVESYKNVTKSNSMFELMYQTMFNQVLNYNFDGTDYYLHSDIYDILLTHQENYVREVESIVNIMNDIMEGAQIYE